MLTCLAPVPPVPKRMVETAVPSAMLIELVASRLIDVVLVIVVPPLPDESVRDDEPDDDPIAVSLLEAPVPTLIEVATASVEMLIAVVPVVVKPPVKVRGTE